MRLAGMTCGRRMDLCGYLGIPGSPPVHGPGPQAPSRPQELVQLAPEAILMEVDSKSYSQKQESRIWMKFWLMGL